MSPAEVDSEAQLGAYASLLGIRGFEERAQDLFSRSQIRGSIHLGIGQEGVAVGARLGGLPGDLVVPTYRGHAYALAWGMSYDAAFGELLGRETGCCRGRGGSKHFADHELGILPGNAVVAAGLPIACGTALADKLDGRPRVTFVPFGDGATNQAAFHEAMNLAAIWKLPVVFLCENNLYSEMTPIAGMVAIERLVDRAAAYGMAGVQVDGMDTLAVEGVLRAAAEHARTGAGPTFVEALTYRFCGHMPGDTESYRSRDEVRQWRERDPLPLFRHGLIGAGFGADRLGAIEASVARELDAAQARAIAAPAPDVAAIGVGAADWMVWQR
ncbi:MAG TPA: thiamine pyrophosphate-dependent dehydrogenase E1 component subunit alpha [Candidatus Limnocylindrales bacterium]|jgi:TPP-dependent pyruvate/acetoin dehydrogenase alpha subunit